MSSEYEYDYEYYDTETPMLYIHEYDKLWIPKEIQSIFSVSNETREVVFEEFSTLQLLEARAFQETKISAIYPPSQTIIAEECFKNCPFLKEIMINTIPNSCFHGCVSLISINPKTLSHHAFYGTNIRYITIPKHIEVIPHYCFETCKQLSEITFEKHSSLKKIEFYACSKTLIKSIEIPKQVEIIYPHAFDLCSCLSTLVFHKNSQLRRIEERAFNGCPIDIVFLPRTIEMLGDYCFSPHKTNHPRIVVTVFTALNHQYTYTDIYYETDVVIEEGCDYAIILGRKSLGCRGFAIIVE
jgi:hypothetical protein